MGDIFTWMVGGPEGHEIEVLDFHCQNNCKTGVTSRSATTKWSALDS